MPFFAGIHSRETTGIDTMSIEGAPESYLAADSIEPQPPAHKGSWVRIVVYLVLVTVLGLIVWKIHENQKLNAQLDVLRSQVAALRICIEEPLRRAEADWTASGT